METLKRIREWMRQKDYDGVILGRKYVITREIRF
ncbi:hypothetical protein BN3456_01856 [Clostridium sp. C105KSO13]|nr:hypothetical protein BN3456_01856 [Clostridium sp. C105KSO13]